jgi:hypothetical protein
VLFTEAGFWSYAHPNRAPWDETPRALAHAGQARCYEAVLKAFYFETLVPRRLLVARRH